MQVGEMLQAKAREEREALLESDKISAEVRDLRDLGRRGKESAGEGGGGGELWNVNLLLVLEYVCCAALFGPRRSICALLGRVMGDGCGLKGT